MKRFSLSLLVGLVAVACAGDPRAPEAGSGVGFDVVEASIADIHRAMQEGRLTARQLVEAYLARIDAYDKRGPALNAVVTINAGALERADELDAALRDGGFVGPLHGIPVIVKDNYDTHDLPTSAGSLSLIDSIPPDDATQVERIRAAGAIVLAKSNMAEFAFSPYETVGSALPGYTRNPYATQRVTAGSSGGTAAAVAASFGAVGLGTDTGNSIRGPSSHQALVGIRSTMGLTSRDGIVPLNLGRDIGGPLARTVEDAVRVFEVIAGYDPKDPVTAASREAGRIPGSYLAHLDATALQGARIGAMREEVDETADPKVVERFAQALDDLRRLGATVIDPVELPGADRPQGGERRGRCSRFAWDLNQYLASLGPEAPVRTLQDIVDSRRYHPSIAQRLRGGLDEQRSPDEQPGCAAALERDEGLRRRLRAMMAQHDLDAIVYPTWDNPPRLIGDLNTPHGDNSQRLSPGTGFPAIQVPMGFVTVGPGGDEVPVGLSILGDAFSEPRLIELAYAYEQGTRHRKPPPTTPPLGILLNQDGVSVPDRNNLK